MKQNVPTKTSGKSLVINLSLLLLSSIFSLIAIVFAVEAVHWLRDKKSDNWHDPNTQFDPNIGWIIPSSRKVEDWGGVSSNSLGARSPAYDPNLKTTIILGDSVAWGFGLSDESTLGYLLSKKAAGLGRQVQNFAVSGYGIDQYYLQFKRVLKIIPKPEQVILVIFAGNDMYDTSTNIRWNVRKPMYIPSASEASGIKLVDTPLSKFSIRNLLGKSYLFDKISNRLQIHPGNNLYNDDVRNGLEDFSWDPNLNWFRRYVLGDRQLSFDDTNAVLRKLLELIVNLAEQNDITLNIVLSSTYADFVQESSHRKYFTSLLDELGYSYLDLFEHLVETKVDPKLLYLYPDGAHYSERGEKLIADLIYKQYFSDIEK